MKWVHGETVKFQKMNRGRTVAIYKDELEGNKVVGKKYVLWVVLVMTEFS
jgi:hypothetical protein